MDIYALPTIGERIKGNAYVGRGIAVGLTADGKKAAAAYFIMGRSANSRNRIFSVDGETVTTRPFDESKVEDPSLIIYAAIRRVGDTLIVTNGDQTDTIAEGLEKGLDFASSLRSRAFEPDAPNFTPRISAALELSKDAYAYQMSILKSADEKGSACNRYTFEYAPLAGVGHFIHTYVCDGNPIPTFQGEPERIAIGNDIDAWTSDIWNNLNEDNRISLYVRMIDLETGESEERLINKNLD